MNDFNIVFKKGSFSNYAFSDNIIELINQYLETFKKDIKHDLKIQYSLNSNDNEENEIPNTPEELVLFLSYEEKLKMHSTQEYQSIYNRIEKSFLYNNNIYKIKLLEDFIGSIMSNYLEKINCEEHVMERPLSKEGRIIPDGSGICILCQKEHPDYFAPIKDVRTASQSFGKKPYVCGQKWDKETSLQCGGSGIVIGKNKNYTTAFFEAFPNVSGYGTFIRGEGKNIDEAEKNAWDKYQKQKSCDNHEFSRTVRGKYRKDGCGICIHCGLFSTKALEPETKCIITGIPTTNNFNGDYICYEEYYKISSEKILEVSLKENQENKLSLFKRTDNEALMSDYINFILGKIIFNHLKEINEHHKYSSTKYMNITSYFEIFFTNQILNIKTFSDKELPNFYEIKDTIDHHIDYFSKNLQKILNKKGKIHYSLMIDKE